MSIAPDPLEVGPHRIGLTRLFTSQGVDPYDEVVWERRDARITNWTDGSVAFEQLDVEFPVGWSQNATNIVAQKYFRGTLGAPERESSLRQVVDRVVDTITSWGIESAYFADESEATAFSDELKYILVTQRAAFNSPVWFNIGVDGVPQQASACYILEVDDTMDSILEWYRQEGLIFKGGSGAGTNLSKIRSSAEHLRGGGTASGPVSFMRGADASAGTIKCLESQTPLYTDRGLVPISSMRPGDMVATRFGFKPVAAVHDNGVRDLVRVRTALGDSVRCTAEHRFMVRNRQGVTWREAGSIEPEDYVRVDLSAQRQGELQPLLPVWRGHHDEHQLRMLDEAMGLWLGWVWGDGSVTNRPSAKFVSVEIGAEDPELIDRYVALTKSVFGDAAHVFVNRRTDGRNRSVGVRVASSALLRFLSTNGLTKAKAHALRIPPIISSSPASVRAAFLAGLFEADGHLRNGYAWLSTVNEGLAVDVHRLLMSIGIPSHLGVINDRHDALGDRPVSTVRIVGQEGMARFAKQVGFISDRKDRELAEACLRKRASTFETQWHLPHVEAELDVIWRATNVQQLRRALSPYCRVREPRRMSLLRARALLDRFPNELGSSSLVQFAIGDDFYTNVSVEPNGEGATFDLTVADVHEYVVQGLVTHNSGGKTRRAAKMVILNADHPDIDEFVACKAIEERKIRVLRDNGFDMDLDGKDSFSVQYQNANNSVRVTDEFMQAVIADAEWDLKAVKTGETLRTIKARDLWHRIAEAAWESADPGLQFDTTINRWHTLANSGRIEASNPCSEFLSLNNSACNLASINLIPFLDDDRFDVGAFKHAVELVFTAQEILVGRADYPTEKLTQNSHDFRQLGLGYTNLGAMLMALGLPYDSTAGRAWAAAITSLMTGHAYATSARTAARIGPFAGFTENEEHMLRVLRMHRDAAHQVEGIDAVPSYVVRAGYEAWDVAVRDGAEHGVRNSQASTLAPTGTISFMMDADTTGIEPDLSLVKTKKLVGGGSMSIVNQTVPRALAHLGYDDDQIAEILAYIDHEKSVIGAPHLAAGHLAVFACSMGDNTIHYEGHVRMLAAVQPFISGAVSKCIAGQSLVPSTDGLVRIGSLHHDEPVDTFRDEILGVDSLTGLQKTSAFYYGGKRHVRRLVLRSGHHVTGTSNHRVLVATEGGLDWRRLDEIQPGELVATKYGAELWSDLPARFDDFVSTPASGSQKRVRIPTEMDETLAFLLGAYAAEGCTTANYTIRFTNSVPAVRDRIVKSWKEAFDLDANVADDGVRCPDVIVASKTVTEFFKYLGVGSRASEKRIPDAILTSPRDHVLAFLDGLSLDAYATASGGAKWAICLDSPGLLDDLQAVLTNLGIVHRRISKFNRTNGKTDDGVYAIGRHARRLGRLIPFLEPDKALRAAQLVAEPIGQNAWDIIPIDSRQLHDLLPTAKSGRNSAGRVRSRFTDLLDKRTRYPSRRTVEMAREMGAKLPPWISQLIDDEMYLSPVESVDDAGVQEVYDLAVPSTQSFVANGIMNHNTTNMPETSTVEEIKHLHQLAWELGLKSIAIYRDNCKVGQPLSTTKKVVTTAPEAVVVLGAGQIVERVIEKIVHRPVRQKLPRNRHGRTYEFRVADCKGFLTVGEYDDGRPGEVFLTVSKQGSTLAGIMDAFAKSISYGLQYGVPLRAFVEAFTNMRFEPAGITDDPEIRFASSVMDYLFRKLAMEYLSYDERAELSIFSVSERLQPTLPGMEESIVETTSGTEMATDPKSVPTAGELADQMEAGTMAITPVDNTPAAGVIRDSDAPMCMQCGVTMIRAGSCHVCPSCGSTSGCS